MADYKHFTEQIRQCCKCFECATDEEWDGAILTAFELWGELTCGNWLDDHAISRRVPLSKECGGCCPRVYETTLPETWIKEDRIKVMVRAWHGIEVEEIAVKSIYDPRDHVLRIDLTDAMDCCDNCVEYDLVIDYEVGTDELPAEFCRWFCTMAKVYMQVEEVQCTQCNDTSDIAIIESDDAVDLSSIYKRMAMQYFKTLVARYSLCYLKSLVDYSVGR